MCPVFQNVNQLADFHETRYECLVTEGHGVVYVCQMRFLSQFAWLKSEKRFE
jgi:hypothetical protein